MPPGLCMPLATLIQSLALITPEKTFDTYEDVIEKGLWLEDQGDYSRYATSEEESVWVNNEKETIEDPDEEAEKNNRQWREEYDEEDEDGDGINPA